MKYDLVIWGATSFVGQLVAERMVNKYGEHLKGRIAFAGRDIKKLRALKTKLKYNADLLVGDAGDESFIFDLVKQTKLVISTVGPYALYGENMVRACAELGRDYCDLTGEPQWIRHMLEKYEAVAKANKARIIHCCGFDSVPSDMGVYYLQSKCLKLFKEPCTEIRYQFRKSKGGISGGTYASLLNAIESIKANKADARKFKTPYALILDQPEGLPFQKSVSGIALNRPGKGFLAPFVMASINTKVVHRTHYLMQFKWGKSFLYDESMFMGTGIKGLIKSTMTTFGLAGFMLMASFGPTRQILKSFMLPKPGEGPNDDVIKAGFFNVRLIGKMKSGKRVELTVFGKGDPGYGSTCKMITEISMELLETSRVDSGTGFLTPASALKSEGLKRLEEKAGIQFRFITLE
ncbi:saccharopine dehydrogenase NADP-binding domain-containing protein [Psychrosphaera sp. B3R10]|uniref:saccharopine dehydrogenase family protein n=1 Tax=unclassified Psychrosphaera TaxID=2641570 RepID=UPI001C098B34|nr:saccharopine dehydrogenase NADP-binding domain-containing protein [Psychrosphaera sp. 1_MG-2023]MBU2880700.1 saccharopine dehydrogenase NADP-binding domain-containing protein [Psychrosphaera sp. I2R16]MBU2991554.1 saccharopine dehydrogenase NADP-binding domain-containing protein [Psychrosphaera sp. B3R10]MDO6719446.1 saccharopine dehydrogenase NADP-binding domain-containing protein [Psychrosphaera sp. 1_MG-2023]